MFKVSFYAVKGNLSVIIILRLLYKSNERTVSAGITLHLLLSILIMSKLTSNGASLAKASLVISISFVIYQTRQLTEIKFGPSAIIWISSKCERYKNFFSGSNYGAK